MNDNTPQGMNRQDALALGISLDYCPVRDRYWQEGQMPPLPVAAEPTPAITVEPISTVIDPVVIHEPILETTPVVDDAVLSKNNKKG